MRLKKKKKPTEQTEKWNVGTEFAVLCGVGETSLESAKLLALATCKAGRKNLKVGRTEARTTARRWL